MRSVRPAPSRSPGSRSLGSIVIVAALWLAGWSSGGGCGGRTLLPPSSAGAAGAAVETGAAGNSGAAGNPGAAGDPATTGGAGAIGHAGATGHAGSSGAAGQSGAGGASACGLCPDPACKPGFMSVVVPAISCCPICRPLDCATVDCAPVVCAAGTHAETMPGQCCPVCVAGPSKACNDLRTQMQGLRKSLLAKYDATPCNVDADCTLVVEQNACVTNCGVALPVSTAPLFTANLEMLAIACDDACPPLAVPPCAPEVAVCSNGLCTALPAGGH